MCKNVTENFATQQDYDDVKKFFEVNPVPVAARSIQQGLESIQVNAAWLSRDKPNLSKFLSSQ